MVNKSENNVVIGGDSASSTDSNIFSRRDQKVFRNRDFVIGCTSSYRMMQLLRFSFSPPDINDKDIYAYMCTDFINEVRRCFRDGGYLQKYSDGDDKGGTFLVGYKNRLFKIESDFQVGESLNDVEACGSGMDFALGSIFSTEGSGESINDRILKALKVAEFLSIGVRAPFVIEHTI